SGRNDVRAAVRSGAARWSRALARRATPRSPRPPPSTAGAATIPTATAASCESRPVALGLAVGDLERLAHGPRDRGTADGHRLASAGPPVVLDMEESPPKRATTDRHRCSDTDSEDGEGESALGCTTDSRRAPETRPRRVSGDGCQVRGATDHVAIAVVAHVL